MMKEWHNPRMKPRLAEAGSPEEQTKEINSYLKSLQQRMDQLNSDKFRAGFSPNTNWTNPINAVKLLQQSAQQENIDHDRGTELNSAQQQQQKDAAAKQGASEEKQRTRELEDLHAQALEAGLTGTALLERKKLDAIEKEKEKLIELDATRLQLAQAEADVKKKFDEDEKKRQDELLAQAQKALRDAQAEGLTGLPRIDAEHQSRLDDINAKKDANGINVSDNVKDLLRQAENLRYNNEVGTFYQESDEKQGTATEEARQRAAAAQRKMADETLQYDRQAAEAERRIKEDGLTGWTANYRNAISDIEDAEQDRLTKLQSDYDAGLVDETNYQRRRQDVIDQANAQIEAQNQQMQRQVASTLEQAFANPVEFIKRKMQEMFAEILANWVMQTKLFQSLFGQQMGALGPGGQQQDGGILGGILRGGGALPGFNGSYARPTFGGSPSIANTGEYSSAGSGGAFPSVSSASASSAGSSPLGTAQFALSAANSPQLHEAVSALHARPQPSAASASGIGIGFPSSDGTPSIAGDGTTVSYPGGTPNIQNGLPGAPMPQGTGSSAGGYAGYANAALGVAGAGMAGYQGYQDTKADFKSGTVSGMLKGTLGDAMSGAAIGSLFGPLGTAIGAGVGAVVGLVSGAAGLIMGEGGKLAARDYYKNTLFPEIENLRNADNITDPLSAVSQINQIGAQGRAYMTQHWGMGAEKWVDDNYLRKELALATGEMIDRARGGAYATKMSAAQFHTGGYIDGFGSLGTGGGEGFIHAMRGESVMNTQAVARHAPVLNAMNDGARPEDVARMYLASTSSRGSSSTATAASSEAHIHIHTLDTKTMSGWLKTGGARLINKHLNGYASQYGGDANG